MSSAGFLRYLPQENSRQSGFSLVELSIVLVILGLLTGGILGGQSLIKAAELRSIGKEYEQWQTAAYTFKTKYLALPGDLPNATAFWGDGDGAGLTWNGDGNGNIDFPLNPSEEGEIFTFWQHLALAGIISGEFTGVGGPGSVEDSLIGENVPASKYGSAGWMVLYISPATDLTAEWFDLSYVNMYEFGNDYTGWDTGAPTLSPEDAWNIDTKLDDGKPGQGSVVIRYWDDCTDATSTSDFDADYLLSDNSEQCVLGFRKIF